ncbi:EKC/KEOPS complex subunit Lage3-like [Saccopteryx leptura]|uniref:EKC/KEOPS complex subunit Lage3-like n=1 Tax=Saccopteryx leptura TaxID=249018 RepID=UPI00339BAA0F
MEAPEDEDKEGSGSVVRGAGPPSSPGGSSKGPGDTGSVAGESAAAEGAPQGEEVSVDSGQAAQAAASDRPMESRGLVLYLFQEVSFSPWNSALIVPFRSYLHAEVARSVLSHGAEPYRGTVHWELTVTGSRLSVRLTAEDSDLLHNAAASLVNRLAMVFRNIQLFEPPRFTTFQLSKGA